MNLRQITYNEFIGRFVTTFKIDTTSWLADAPYLLNDAINDLDINLALVSKKQTVPVVNYRATVPAEIKLIQAVKYNGLTLRNKQALNGVDIIGTNVTNVTATDWYNGITTSTVADECYCSGKFVLGAAYYTDKLITNVATGATAVVASKVSNDELLLSADIFLGTNEYFTITIDKVLLNSTYTYELDGNGGMIFEFEEGDIDIYYKYLGIDDAAPLIPDLYQVIEACKFYILRRLLYRGYVHPIFNLDSGNQFTNVNIIYEGVDGRQGLKRKARVEATTLDGDIRRQLINISAFTSQLTSLNSHLEHKVK